MKKNSVILSLLLIICIVILFLSFKNIDNTYIYARELNFKNDNQLLAIAYLNDLSEVNSKYINNLENIKVYNFSEEDLCLIIPRYNDMNIKIYSVNIDDEEIEKDVFISEVDFSFVTNCNSNVMLEINYDKKIYDYRFLEDSKYILDITK